MVTTFPSARQYLKRTKAVESISIVIFAVRSTDKYYKAINMNISKTNYYPIQLKHSTFGELRAMRKNTSICQSRIQEHVKKVGGGD